MSDLLDIQDREILREKCIARRQALLVEDVNRFSHSIATKIFCSNIWRRAKTIGLYSSIKNEVSTDALLRQAWQEGKKVFLPRCIIYGEKPLLEFVCCRDWSELVPGPFGILEPDQSRVSIDFNRDIPDIVLVPAVALTKNGYRLGYGKGFYDYLFAQPLWKHVVRIALVYSFQFVNFAPHSFDVPVHGYVTESEFVWMS